MSAMALGFDFNQMIKNAGQRKNQIKKLQDLRPAVYSVYDPMAVSTVIDGPIEGPKVQTTIVTASAVSLMNKKGAGDATKNVADQRRSTTGFSSKHEIERRALM